MSRSESQRAIFVNRTTPIIYSSVDDNNIVFQDEQKVFLDIWLYLCLEPGVKYVLIFPRGRTTWLIHGRNMSKAR
jgi:hypothetical protein